MPDCLAIESGVDLVLDDGHEQALSEYGPVEVLIKVLDDEVQHASGSDGRVALYVAHVADQVRTNVSRSDESDNAVALQAMGPIGPKRAELLARVHFFLFNEM